MAGPPAPSAWARFRAAQLDVLFRVQGGRDGWLGSGALYLLCSPHPLYDVSLLPYAVWVGAMPFFGVRVIWAGTVCLFAAMLSNWIIRARCPREVDARLRMLAQVSPHGFPVVEVHMATALCADVAWSAGAPWCWAVVVVIVLLVAITRIFSVSYFPDQVAGSVLTGAACVAGAYAAGARLFAAGLTRETHMMLLVFVGFSVLAYVAYLAEQNASPFMRVPRSECAPPAVHPPPPPSVAPPLLDVVSAQMRTACAHTPAREYAAAF